MVSDNYLLIETSSTNQNIPCLGLPGQFYQIKLPGDSFQLRVPISIYDKYEDKISFLIKIVGEKTKKLQEMKVTDVLDVIGPLGTSFVEYSGIENQESGNRYLFISGGCGYAPLNFLHNHLLSSVGALSLRACEAIQSQTNITWIHGGKNKDEVSFIETANNSIILCTDDGSVGKKGFVTEEVKDKLNQHDFDKVFVCGPVPMMKAVHELCKYANITTIVSLEEYMACGVGVCYGCAVKVKNESGGEMYVRVCKEGPVFDANMVVW